MTYHKKQRSHMDRLIDTVWGIFLLVAGICASALAVAFTLHLLGKMQVL